MDLIAAKNIANELMQKHGLIADGWTFGYDNAKMRLGVCRFRTKKINMSRLYTINSNEVEVKDTILHEIAHALVGPVVKHGWIWKMKARELGAEPSLASSTVKALEGIYKTSCSCGIKHATFHRRPRKQRHCRNCGEILVYSKNATVKPLKNVFGDKVNITDENHIEAFVEMGEAQKYESTIL